MGRRALIIIDLQLDFCPGGALAVREGDRIVPVINDLIRTADIVVATQDWHPADHISFASNHVGKALYDTILVDGREQTLWPDHCVQGSAGAGLHPDLELESCALILRKGMSATLDSYSAFFENDHSTPTGLHGYLQELGVTEVDLCGLATDYCVHFSAVDAVRLGYRTSVILEAVRGVDVPEGNVARSLQLLEELGVHVG